MGDFPPALPPKAKRRSPTIVLQSQTSIEGSENTEDNQLHNLESFKEYGCVCAKQQSISCYSANNSSKPVPAPRALKKQNSDISQKVPLSCDASVQQPPNSFFNPLYFSVDLLKSEKEDSKTQGIYKNLKNTDPPNVQDQQDLDIINTSIKEDWTPKFKSVDNKVHLRLKKSESLRLSGSRDSHIKKETRIIHSYEEVEPVLSKSERNQCDIFDTISFKSPLYETWKKNQLRQSEIDYLNTIVPMSEKCIKLDEQPSSSDIYDIPLPENPPPPYPPPPLPREIIAEEIENMQSIYNKPVQKPSPSIPPRPSLNSLHVVPQETVSSQATASQNAKGAVPSRPAPPVPRYFEQGLLPPPIPERTHPIKSVESVASGSHCETNSTNVVQSEEMASGVNLVPVNIDLPKPDIIASTNKCASVKQNSYSGILYKTGSNRKEFLQRWCTLQDGNLSYFVNQKSSSPKDTLKKSDICGVSLCSYDRNSVVNSNLPELCCFEIATNKERGRKYLFGAKLPSERTEWILHITLAIAPPTCLSVSLTKDLIHSGYLHMKEGTSGQWQLAWIVLSRRSLNIHRLELGTTEEMNLQKSMGVEKLPLNSGQEYVAAYEAGPVFHIDMPQQSLYLQGEWTHHTNAWLQDVFSAWKMPQNAHLEDHYLTQDNIPVVVDKCLNFVSTHGTTDEGIYRLCGSASRVRKLLEDFNKNAWSVHLKRDEYSPHDVATALKRFLRNLPECILTEKLSVLWAGTNDIENQDERLKTIRDLLHKLPLVYYQTLKKLIGHLYIICEHSDKNLMPVINIAPIFGPCLLFKADNLDTGVFDKKHTAMDIVADCITHYSLLFEVDPKDIEKERKIQQALELLREAKIAQRPAGDILVGVYVHSKDWGRCLNVRLTPTMTAEELCQYAIFHADVRESVDSLAVYEVVCNEELERPLHYSEIVLAVTLRWATWADSDAKSNYLCIKHNYILDAVMPHIQTRQPLSMFSELKFADVRTKTFKKYLFEFIGAKLTCYKDTRASHPVGQWNVEDITWYIGSETKRCAPTKWTFTFIDRNTPIKRTKDHPYFGRTVSCNLEEEYHKWLAAMLLGEHPQNLLPAHPTVDLLS